MVPIVALPLLQVHDYCVSAFSVFDLQKWVASVDSRHKSGHCRLTQEILKWARLRSAHLVTLEIGTPAGEPDVQGQPELYETVLTLYSQKKAWKKKKFELVWMACRLLGSYSHITVNTLVCNLTNSHTQWVPCYHQFLWAITIICVTAFKHVILDVSILGRRSLAASYKSKYTLTSQPSSSPMCLPKRNENMSTKTLVQECA